MAGSTQIQGKIVLEYLEKWRNLPSSTLAKKIYAENKTAFNCVETIRTSIRYYRGAQGDRARKSLKNLEFVDHNPFNLPSTDETEFFPYIYPKEADDVLCLYDVHIPYHNREALTAALEYGQKNKVNSIFLGGDFIDCHKVSSYQPDPRKRNVLEEVIMAIQILQAIRKAFPDAFIFYLQGNHDERLLNYLMVKAPEIFDLEILDFPEIFSLVSAKHLELDFNTLKINFQTCSKQTIKMGGLNLIHGHELGSSVMSPVNIARGLFLRAKTSTMCGHHHQVSEHTETNLNGNLTTCWSVGTLGELHPAYLPNNKWSHGFAHVRWNDEQFSVRNFRILDGQIL